MPQVIAVIITRWYSLFSRLSVLSGFVIGTDGIRSSVRECLLETEGIRMESFGTVDDMVHVEFKSKELGMILKQQNPGMLHLVMNGKVSSSRHDDVKWLENLNCNTSSSQHKI